MTKQTTSETENAQTGKSSRKRSDTLQDAAERVERELKEVVEYINAQVVPSVRKHSSRALRSASRQLEKLADHMDQYRRRP